MALICSPHVRYERRDVEALLTAWFNGSALQYEWDRPAPGMPRSKRDPRRGDDVSVGLMDVARAWGRANLSMRQKDSIYIRYGLGLTAKEAAVIQARTSVDVDEDMTRGVARLVAAINGRAVEEEE